MQLHLSFNNKTSKQGEYLGDVALIGGIDLLGQACDSEAGVVARHRQRVAVVLRVALLALPRHLAAEVGRPAGTPLHPWRSAHTKVAEPRIILQVERLTMMRGAAQYLPSDGG